MIVRFKGGMQMTMYKVWGECVNAKSVLWLFFHVHIKTSCQKRVKVMASDTLTNAVYQKPFSKSLSNLVRVQWPGSNPKTCTFARRIILVHWDHKPFATWCNSRGSIWHHMRSRKINWKSVYLHLGWFSQSGMLWTLLSDRKFKAYF